jgi:hypothetical protein
MQHREHHGEGMLSFLVEANEDLRKMAIDQSKPLLQGLYEDDQGSKPSKVLKTCVTHFKDRFREILKKSGALVPSLTLRGKPSSSTLTTPKGSLIWVEQLLDGTVEDVMKGFELGNKPSGKVLHKRILTPSMERAGFQYWGDGAVIKAFQSLNPGQPKFFLDYLSKVPANKTGFLFVGVTMTIKGFLMVYAVMGFHNYESRPEDAPSAAPPPARPSSTQEEKTPEGQPFLELDEQFRKFEEQLAKFWDGKFKSKFSNPKWAPFVARPVWVDLEGTGGFGLSPKESAAGKRQTGAPSEDFGIQAYVGRGEWTLTFRWTPKVKQAIEDGDISTAYKGGVPGDLLEIKLGRLHACSLIRVEDGELLDVEFAFAEADHIGGGKNINLFNEQWSVDAQDAADTLAHDLREDWLSGVLDNLEEWMKYDEDQPLRELAELSWGRDIAGGGFMKVDREGRGYRASPWISKGERSWVSDEWDSRYAQPLLEEVQRACDAQLGKDQYLAVEVDPSDGSVYLERDILHQDFRN